MSKTLGMSSFSLELAQSLLNQTRSIDETSLLMAVDGDKHNWRRWRDKIIHSIEKGDIKI